MAAQIPNQGPLLHRIIVVLFSILLCALIFWLIGFILSDIGKWERPDRIALEDQYIPTELKDQMQALKEEQSR